MNSSKTLDELQNSSQPSKLDRAFIKLKLFKERHQVSISRTKILFLNVVVVGYFAWATYHFIDSSTSDTSDSNTSNYLKHFPNNFRKPVRCIITQSNAAHKWNRRRANVWSGILRYSMVWRLWDAHNSVGVYLHRVIVLPN